MIYKVIKGRIRFRTPLHAGCGSVSDLTDAPLGRTAAGEIIIPGTAVAGALTGRTGRRVIVHLRGGDLLVEWAEDDHVFLTGPAAEVFTGQVAPEVIESARV